MTLGDLLKRVNYLEDRDKMIVYSDGKGWTNIDVEIIGNNIIIKDSDNSPFSDDKQL